MPGEEKKKKSPIRINRSDLNRLLETAKTTKQTLNPSSHPVFRGVAQKSGDAGGRSLGPQVAERSSTSHLLISTRLETGAFQEAENSTTTQSWRHRENIVGIVVQLEAGSSPVLSSSLVMHIKDGITPSWSSAWSS